MSSEQTILARLLTLENDNEARAEEIKKLKDNIYVLQTENFDFKKDLFIIRNENERLKDKIAAMEKKMVHLVQDIPNVTKSSTTISKTDITDDLKRRISAVEEHTRRLQQSNKTILKKTAVVTSKVDGVETKVDTLSGLQKVLNRTLVERHNGPDLKNEVDDLKLRTKQLEMTKRNISQSFTYAVLMGMEGKKLKQNVYLKLDECRYLVSKGMFDVGTCDVVPRCDGKYVFLLNYLQLGDGKVNVYLKGDGTEVGKYIGQTSNNNEACCAVTSLYLKKGQNVWLEATRLEGDADIGWCRVMCWIVG